MKELKSLDQYNKEAHLPPKSTELNGILCPLCNCELVDSLMNPWTCVLRLIAIPINCNQCEFKGERKFNYEELQRSFGSLNFLNSDNNLKSDLKGKSNVRRTIKEYFSRS